MTRLCPKAARPTINPSPPIIQSITKPRKASSEPRRPGAAATGIRFVSDSMAREFLASTPGSETRFAISLQSGGAIAGGDLTSQLLANRLQQAFVSRPVGPVRTDSLGLR